MANHRLPMHLLRQILLLQQQQKSIRDIARSLGLARNTIRGYLRMIPLADAGNLHQQTDEQLDQLIQTRQPPTPPDSQLATLQQRFAYFDSELTRPGVTRYGLWLEYKEQQTNGYQYTAAADRPVLPLLPVVVPTATGGHALRPQSRRQTLRRFRG